MADCNASNIIPLHSGLHKNLRVRNANSFSHVRTRHMVPVTIHEFSMVGSEFPIVFVSNTDTGQLQPVAVMGLVEGENLFLSGNVWKGSYIPRSIRNHPFFLVANGYEEGQMMIAINEGSPYFSETDGDALFEESGGETEYLKGIKQTLLESLNQDQLTKDFVSDLREMDLIIPQSIELNTGKGSYCIRGIYIVDEKRLSTLGEEAVSRMHRRGLLPLIYAHLMSLHQFSKLARMQRNI